HPGLFRYRQPDRQGPDEEALPDAGRRTQLLARLLQPQDQAFLLSGHDRLRRCDHRPLGQQQGGQLARGSYKLTDRLESTLTAADPLTGEVKKNIAMKYPNSPGFLSTAGGVVFTGLLDGTFAAYDDAPFEQLWKINVGIGFSAPPMSFEVNGKQY